MTQAPADLRDVTPGSRWRSEDRTLGEVELELACKLSGDSHPIHADAAYAASTPLGQRIFQGGYGAMIALGMATHFPSPGARNALALGMESWVFKAPLFIGDVVHVEVEITGLRRTSDGRRMAVHKTVSLIKQTGEVAQQGIAGSLVTLDALDMRDGQDIQNGDTP